MAELTADIVRTIIKEELGSVQGEIGSLREDMRAEFKNVRQEMAEGFNAVRQDMAQEFKNVRHEMNEGIDQVLATVQSFHDEDQDEIAGIEGRLSNHNQRIAKLERLSKIR